MRPLNCCECGRFIGPDGNPDIGFDPYMGAYEIGYPRCGPCLRSQKELTAMNLIPMMTHPLSQYWQQPEHSSILVDETHAIMTLRTFNLLLEYSHSLPSGVYEGKMWRSHHSDGDWLHWYDKSDHHPGWCTIKKRQILIC